jgi:putative ABC transport system ATP-binding protein
MAASAEPVVVESHDVWKSYPSEAGPVDALRGIDLAIHRGEMVAVMGPSGCGKTTLLNCFSGLDDISRGKVLLEGTDVHAMSDRQKTVYRAKRMGFVFQSYNLLPVLTADENVEFPLLVSGVPRKEARARAHVWLKELGLEGKERVRPAELSGGEQQRVTLARALANQPAIVWADEPTGNLDEQNAQEVMTLLRSLNREHHQTFVVVTHDPDVARTCDRTLRMRDGRIVDA